MLIGLIDVDAWGKKPKFPNLALMRLSSYHKARGDTVEWYRGPLEVPMYDIVYMSKVFSDAYTPDVPEPLNAELVIKGGTGYCISLVDGREVFDESKNVSLAPEIEKMFPDYSIYPQFDFAVSMTTRGCPRGCPFCIVAKKEGRGSVKVADVSDFWNGQPHIEVLDANITACCEKRDLMKQYLDTGATINFNQGLDIRLIDDDDIADLNAMRLESVHFAWDFPSQDLTKYFENYAKKGRHTRHGTLGVVYVLTNFERCTPQEHLERALYRIYKLRDLGYRPYVTTYNAPSAPKELLRLKRWCNSRIIYLKVPRFEDFDNRYEKKKDEPSKPIITFQRETKTPQQTLF